ncbi:hypothetical protein F4824DRAFT_500995 [Ustulina deusta]|nr:hypothetical protein F4824DRAFT_500995 [Ustulina deusta]
MATHFGSRPPKPKRPFQFYMSVLTICLPIVMMAWDAASLAIALPVSQSQPFFAPSPSHARDGSFTNFILRVVTTRPIDVLREMILAGITSFKERPLGPIICTMRRAFDWRLQRVRPNRVFA